MINSICAVTLLSQAYDRVVAPNRLVTSGVYAHLQHPIYTSYMVRLGYISVPEFLLHGGLNLIEIRPDWLKFSSCSYALGVTASHSKSADALAGRQ